MVSKIIKGIIILLVLGGIVFLFKKFPYEIIIGLGVLLIIVIGKWWLDVEQRN